MSVNDYGTALMMLQQWVGTDPYYRSFRIDYSKGEDGGLVWSVKLWSQRWRNRETHWYQQEYLVVAAQLALEDADGEISGAAALLSRGEG